MSILEEYVDKPLPNNLLIIYNLIKEYCETYGEWPKRYDNPKNNQEKVSLKLRFWLYSHIERDKTKRRIWRFLKTEDGNLVLDELESLRKKYEEDNKYSEEHIITMFNKVINYCDEYQEFPVSKISVKNEKEELSKKLYRWLHNSQYLNGRFIYSRIKKDGVSIKTILDYYYFRYGVKDIWSAKDSYDIASTAYYYVLNIWKEKEKNNDSMVKYYYDSLKTKLKNRFSDFNIDEIMEILNQDIDTISEYFLNKYLTYSIANDTWIYFYKSLYEYSLYKKQNDLKKDR